MMLPQLPLKVCTKCGESKPFEMFSKDGHKNKVGKYNASCKACMAANSKIWHLKNKEKAIKSRKKYYLNNKEKIAEAKILYAKTHPEVNKKATEKYRKANREKCAAASKKWMLANSGRKNITNKLWNEKNSELIRAYCVNRRAKRAHATPVWEIELTEFASIEASDLCILRENHTKFKWEVDHIIPLQGKIVSGLHVWNNFDVVPFLINRSKGNRLLENFDKRERPWLG